MYAATAERHRVGSVDCCYRHLARETTQAGFRPEEECGVLVGRECYIIPGMVLAIYLGAPFCSNFSIDPPET